jgi:hypothetical protein
VIQTTSIGTRQIRHQAPKKYKFSSSLLSKTHLSCMILHYFNLEKDTREIDRPDPLKKKQHKICTREKEREKRERQ